MSNRIVKTRRPASAIAPRPAEVAPDDRTLAGLRECFADIDDRRPRAFLAGFVAGMGIGNAARLSGVDRSCHYDWMKKDIRYRERFQRARMILADDAEQEVYRRAFRGVDTPIVHRGKITGWYKSYSDALAMFMLKALRPNVYRDNAEIPVGPAEINIRVVTPEERQKAREAERSIEAVGDAAQDGTRGEDDEE